MRELDGASQATGKVEFGTKPDGDYVFEIEKVIEEDKLDNEGTLTLKYTCLIVDGPDTESGDTTIGDKYTHTIWLKGKSHPDYKEENWKRGVNDSVIVAKACGTTEIVGNKVPTKELVGKRFKARMSTREYDDKKTGEKRKANQLSYISAVEAA